MKRIAILLTLVLVGCSKPPVEGYVIGGDYTPAWTQHIPGTPPTQSCSGGYSNVPRTCTWSPGTMPQWIQHRASWELELQNTRNDDRDKTGTREVTEDVYNRCNIGEKFPDCADPNMGDTR